MTFATMQDAVSDYLEREEKAMRTAKGADHAALMAEVAKVHELNPDDLSNAVIEATIFGAN